MNLLLIDHGFAENVMLTESKNLWFKSYHLFKGFVRFRVCLVVSSGDERRFYDYFFGVN